MKVGVIRDKFLFIFIISFTFLLSNTAFADKNLESLLAVLFTQTSAEMKATQLQTFQTATNLLDDALKDSSWTAIPNSSPKDKPPAIILDVDETVLDNSFYNARNIIDETNYPENWSDWVFEENAKKIPGSLEFLKIAQSYGIKIFYVTNRAAEYETATRNNLKKLNYPFDDDEDVLLMKGEKGWESSKESRRNLIAKNYRVLMIFGDNFIDFVEVSATSAKQRKNRVEEYSDYWGEKWFMLPNPVYGYWERSLYEFQNISEEQRTKKRLELLEIN